jgi:hypothetical protein|tara:strand:- start:36176 stop:36304 length:129 start_codon:yes stop_codon:yes gene_type:complete
MGGMRSEMSGGRINADLKLWVFSIPLVAGFTNGKLFQNIVEE